MVGKLTKEKTAIEQKFLQLLLEKYSILWLKSHPEYFHRNKIENGWEAVATEMGETPFAKTGEEWKDLFKNLRDQYRNYKNKLVKKSGSGAGPKCYFRHAELMKAFDDKGYEECPTSNIPTTLDSEISDVPIINEVELVSENSQQQTSFNSGCATKKIESEKKEIFHTDTRSRRKKVKLDTQSESWEKEIVDLMKKRYSDDPPNQPVMQLWEKLFNYVEEKDFLESLEVQQKITNILLEKVKFVYAKSK